MTSLLPFLSSELLRSPWGSVLKIKDEMKILAFLNATFWKTQCNILQAQEDGGRGVCLRQRQKIFILLGAFWKVCWALHRTYSVWTPPGSSGISKATSWRRRVSTGRAQGPDMLSLSLPCLCLPAGPYAGLPPWLDSGQLQGIHRKHFVYLEARSTVLVRENHTFGDVKRISIWVTPLGHITFFHQKESQPGRVENRFSLFKKLLVSCATDLSPGLDSARPPAELLGARAGPHPSWDLPHPSWDRWSLWACGHDAQGMV